MFKSYEAIVDTVSGYSLHLLIAAMDAVAARRDLYKVLPAIGLKDGDWWISKIMEVTVTQR